MDHPFPAPGEEDRLADALRRVVSTPAGKSALQEAGAQFFKPLFDLGLVAQLERFFRRAHHALPVQNVSVGVAPAVQLLEKDLSRIRCRVANLGNRVVYLGSDRNVQVGAAGDIRGGFPLFAGDTVEIDFYVGQLWAVSDQAGQDVRVIDVSG